MPPSDRAVFVGAASVHDDWSPLANIPVRLTRLSPSFGQSLQGADIRLPGKAYHDIFGPAAHSANVPDVDATGAVNNSTR